MEVTKVESPAGELIKIQLTRTGDGAFKDEMMTWIQANYPDWGYEGFFRRMTVFNAGSCIVDMRL